MLLSSEVCVSGIPEVIREDRMIGNEDDAACNRDFAVVSIGLGIVSIDVRIIDSYNQVCFPCLWICDIVDVVS